MTCVYASNVAAHVLGIRYPEYSHEQLTRWFRHHNTRGRVLKHLLVGSNISLQLLDKLDLISRTAESARLYGIDFFSVLSRGSQYRVEVSNRFAVINVPHM